MNLVYQQSTRRLLFSFTGRVKQKYCVVNFRTPYIYLWTTNNSKMNQPAPLIGGPFDLISKDIQWAGCWPPPQRCSNGDYYAVFEEAQVKKKSISINLKNEIAYKSNCLQIKLQQKLKWYKYKSDWNRSESFFCSILINDIYFFLFIFFIFLFIYLFIY